MRERHPRWTAYWLAASAFMVSCVACAQTTTTTYGPFTLTNTSGTQLSNAVFNINVSTNTTLLVQYTASAGHCSDVRVHIIVDGVERGLTAFLAPGQSSAFVNVGPVSPGGHVVGLQGEGRVGGCNTGVLAGWGGTAAVTVDASAVPAPGLLLSALALLVGTALFGPWRRR